MYTINRISVNDHCSDGSPIYEQQWEYPTWRAMMFDLDRRCSQFHASSGLGSDIFHNDQRLGNVRIMNQIDKSYRQFTRRDFLALVAEDD